MIYEVNAKRSLHFNLLGARVAAPAFSLDPLRVAGNGAAFKGAEDS